MLIRDDPQNQLADNSQYWIGECYYSKMEFKRSISEFENVFNFPGTDKNDDAQLKIGMSYLAMNNTVDAKIQFQKLLAFQDVFFEISKKYVSISDDTQNRED